MVKYVIILYLSIIVTSSEKFKNPYTFFNIGTLIGILDHHIYSSLLIKKVNKKKRDGFTSLPIPLSEALELPYKVGWTEQMLHAERGMHSLADTLTRCPKATQPTST